MFREAAAYFNFIAQPDFDMYKREYFAESEAAVWIDRRSYCKETIRDNFIRYCAGKYNPER